MGAAEEEAQDLEAAAVLQLAPVSVDLVEAAVVVAMEAVALEQVQAMPA